MDEPALRALLERLRTGETTVDDVVRALRDLPFADLGFARVDHHRELRLGLPEAVYGPGKTPEQAAAIVAALLERSSGPVLVTRATPEQRKAIDAIVPEAVYHEAARLIVAREAAAREGVVAVVCAGTADIPVAEEAAVGCEAQGFTVRRVRDAGVAGIHRLLASRAALDEADVVVVVAGMEGALASVVGGLVARPVVAVPTSVGYGAGAGGIAPLLTMLNSCAPGVAVVNIDNGYGAAALVWRILAARAPTPPPASAPLGKGPPAGARSPDDRLP
ncbi:MAG TPA: nickel pincer cofactor biosynthesis protein LarB [Actinomycetota bacterium]